MDLATTHDSGGGETGILAAIKGLAATVLGSALRSIGLVLVVAPLCCGLAWWFFGASKVLSGFRGYWTALMLACALAAGALITLKRALLSALEKGVASSRLGGRTVTALFDRMLPEDGAVAQAAQLLPLATAEARLRAAVTLLLEAERGRGLARRLQTILVGRIEALTLARFRADQAQGIDLLKVRDDISALADHKLTDHFRGARRTLTLAFAVGAPIAVAVLSLAARTLLPLAWAILAARSH